MNAKIIKPSLFAWLCFQLVITACSSHKQKTAQHSKQKTASAKLLPHDRYSAPLHAASKVVRATDFETKLLKGGTFQLSQKKGKVVVLNIWATWCPPCEEETPALEAAYKQFKSRDVIFLGISIDEQGPSVVQPFIKKHDVSYSVTIDDGSIKKKYGPLMGIPTTYIIDQNGDLRYFATGAITKEELAPRLNNLLNEKS